MGLETLRADIPAKLKEKIGDEAEAAGLPINEYVAKVFADLYQKPELGVIKRRLAGRPRKRITAA